MQPSSIRSRLIKKSSVLTRHLVVGLGEVGRSLAELLGECPEFTVMGRDLKDNIPVENTDVLHVCIPYSEFFVEIVKGYMYQYNDPKLVVVHSTVQVGTTRQLGPSAVHSPVQGMHPDLLGGLKKFVKPIGGVDYTSCYEAKLIFEKVGVKCQLYSTPEATELGKILCLARYGLNIAFAQEQQRVCEKAGVDYSEAVTDFQRQYNEGWSELNHPEYVGPILFPGYIGGHCVMMGTQLLGKYYPSNFVDSVVKSNNKKKMENGGK